MNRKMTLLALAANCGGLGASGLARAGPRGDSAATARPGGGRRPARASPVNPAPASQRNSRRVRRQKVPGGPGWSLGRLGLMTRAPSSRRSIDVEEFVEVQDDQAEGPQRLLRAGAVAGPQRLDQA